MLIFHHDRMSRLVLLHHYIIRVIWAICFNDLGCAIAYAYSHYNHLHYYYHSYYQYNLFCYGCCCCCFKSCYIFFYSIDTIIDTIIIAIISVSLSLRMLLQSQLLSVQYNITIKFPYYKGPVTTTPAIRIAPKQAGTVSKPKQNETE